jgi:hypothetical protein
MHTLFRNRFAHTMHINERKLKSDLCPTSGNEDVDGKRSSYFHDPREWIKIEMHWSPTRRNDLVLRLPVEMI